ncbi:uncharacterized protein FFB14_01432 [Fusarium fujikuroi]|nr:uncharacterized protein FFB14_01432 [Fusarium fujikuroi]
MSFGFGVGDFIAVGELCWKIYTRVYKVSRDAPEELRALIQELGNLSNTVNLLNEELRDQEEWIKRAGKRRLEYTCKVMGQAKETLDKMDRLADKYAQLGTGDSSEGSRRSFRIQWNRVKYAFEVSSINELRAKFMSHNLHLTLLLQGAQNSSLERIEKQQTKTDIKLEELRNVMIGDRNSRESPLLKAPLGEEVRAELSAAFLRSAETGNRPWASIGIDDWLQAGKWWLLKARSQIGLLAQGPGGEVHAYINLLKACWILTEIVSIHPQRTHLGASNDRRNDDIRNLSQVAKTSLEGFPVLDFQLLGVEQLTINIWDKTPPSSTIAPRRQFSTNSDKPRWQTVDGEVLFQCFAEICSTKRNTENIPEECFLMLEVPRQGIYLNLILQNFAGQDILKLSIMPDDETIGYSEPDDKLWLVLRHRMEDMGSFVRLLNDSNALLAIIWAFQVFRTEFRPASLTVSMVHSVSVIANWPARHWRCLMLPGHDTGGPDRSDSVATLLRTVINGLGEKLDQDKRQNSMLLTDDIQRVRSPLGVCVWKVICWQCEKFEDFKFLLEEFNAKEHLQHESLVQTSFLKLDRNFLSQMEQHLNYEDGWNPPDIFLMLYAALGSEDAGYTSLLLEKLAPSLFSENQVAIFDSINHSGSPDQIKALAQVIVTRPASIAAIMASFSAWSDEQDFRDFLHIVKRATLQQENTGTKDQERKAQGIVEHLSRLSNLEDARLEHTDALLFYHVLIQIEGNGVHLRNCLCHSWCTTDATTDYQEAWRCMAHLLYRDSFFTSFCGPCHNVHTGSWKANPETRSKLMSRYTEFPEQYPKHLLTQINWDMWRRDALKILSMVK